KISHIQRQHNGNYVEKNFNDRKTGNDTSVASSFPPTSLPGPRSESVSLPSTTNTNSIENSQQQAQPQSQSQPQAPTSPSLFGLANFVMRTASFSSLASALGYTGNEKDYSMQLGKAY